MNEKIIKEIIDDYSLRELQIYSSLILSNIDATNTTIKQFKADHNSHQFYKNVIYWYVKKQNTFPEDFLTFDFVLNDGGLGDRFVITSNILNTFNEYDHEGTVNLYMAKTRKYQTGKLLKADNFYDVIDFFHFKRPKQKIVTHIKDKWINQNDVMMTNVKKDKKYNYFSKLMFSETGYYWPIDFKPKPKILISYMFYMNGEENKSINEFMMNKFKKLTQKFTNLKFHRLEDLNFSKNVELLSQSHLLIASEGMWTHLSRAMKIDTIAFTDLIDFIIEFNSQGHFCSNKFDDCLNVLQTKCINLTK
tara:strand:- start:1716 stop:2630 length:915 start_codon:yes stop_codon:yes gene_type:complete